MNMSIRSVTAALILLGAIFALIAPGRAVEMQLAGAQLNESIMEFITRPGWGLPEGIGPLAQAGATTAAKTSTENAAASSSSAQAGGRRIRDEVRYPGAAGRLNQTRTFASPANRVTTQAAQAATATTATKNTNEMRGTGGIQYWLYAKSNGLRIVLGVEPSGNIATITAQGPPNYQVRTSRGVGLGSSYFDLINFYGYPENTQSLATGLRIAYPDQDVIFLLQNLQVTEITVGQPPALSTTQKSTAPTGRGNSGRPGYGK
jgi:hypothetical protein